MEMVLTPPPKQKSTRRNSTPKLTTRSKLSKKCEFCQKIHSKFKFYNISLINFYESDDNKFHDKIKCFMGYYGLTKAFVHSRLKTPEKDQKRENSFAKSVDEAAQNYPKF